MYDYDNNIDRGSFTQSIDVLEFKFKRIQKSLSTQLKEVLEFKFNRM